MLLPAFPAAISSNRSPASFPSLSAKGDRTVTAHIRHYMPNDRSSVLQIINRAAQVYRGVIPDDCWHDPYMSPAELDAEIADGVLFSCCAVDGVVVGVMGSQTVRNVRLIRHAYVLPEWQGHGIGAALIAHICQVRDRPILVGTWRAAAWAIRFYERHGFARLADADIAPLLRCYWTISDRQVRSSILLSDPPLATNEVRRLIETGARPGPCV